MPVYEIGMSPEGRFSERGWYPCSINRHNTHNPGYFQEVLEWCRRHYVGSDEYRPGVISVWLKSVQSIRWWIVDTEVLGYQGNPSDPNFNPLEGNGDMTKKTGVRRENGLLVYLTIRSWGGSVKDAELTRQVAQSTGGKESQYKVGKVLATQEELKEWKTLALQLRNFRIAFAPPADDIAPGSYFLRTKMYKLFKEKTDPILAALDQAKVNFIRAYPAILAEGPKRLGSGWDPKDYPTVDEIGDYFGVSLEFRPLPEQEKLSFEDLSPEEQERVTKSVEEAYEKLSKSVQGEGKKRLKAAVKRLVERVGALVAKQKGEAPASSGRLYDSVMENLKEVLATIPGLNIEDDAEIEALVKEIAEKLVTDTESLRQDPAKAQEVLDAAKDIEAKMSDWGS